MKKKNKKESWVHVVFERITHFIVGIVSFATLAGSVVLIFKANEFIKSLGVDETTMFVLHAIEMAWLLFDTYVNIRFIARKIYHDFDEDDEDS